MFQLDLEQFPDTAWLDQDFFAIVLKIIERLVHAKHLNSYDESMALM